MHAGPVGDSDRRAIRLAVAVLVLEQQDIALLAAGHVNVALIRYRDDAGIADTRSERLHCEPARGLDLSDAVGRRRDLVGLEDADRILDFSPVSLLSGRRKGDGRGEGGDAELEPEFHDFRSPLERQAKQRFRWNRQPSRLGRRYAGILEMSPVSSSRMPFSRWRNADSAA